MKAILFAVLAGLCWGCGELLTKMVLRTGRIGPMSVLMVRAVIEVLPAIAAYWVAAVWLRSEPTGWWRLETPLVLKLVIGPGVLAGFLGVLFFYLGLKFGPISTVKPIAFAVGPAVAVVLAAAVLGERITVVKAVGVAMVLAGIVLISGNWGLPAATPR
jgi:uncharacterized membrane protein